MAAVAPIPAEAIDSIVQESKKTDDNVLLTVITREVSSITTIFKDLFEVTDKRVADKNTRIRRWKDKLAKVNFKWLVQNKYFQKSLQVLKKIAKGVSVGALGAIFGLLAFAVFDPKGKLLTSLINMFSRLLTQLIGFLPKLFARLPGVLNAVAEAFKKALPQLIKVIQTVIPLIIDSLFIILPLFARLAWELLLGVIDGLFAIIGTTITKVFSKLKAIPVLKSIVEFFEKLKNSVSPDFVKGFGKITAGIVILLFVLAKVIKVLTVLKPLLFVLRILMVKLLIPLLIALKAIIFGIMSALIGLVVAIGWIPLAIAAVIGLGVLLYVFWEDIKKFFVDTFYKIRDMVRNMNTWVKVILIIILAPLIAVGAAIFYMAKLWLWLFSALWDAITPLWDWIVTTTEVLADFFKDVGRKLWSFFKRIPSMIGKGLSSMFKSAVQFLGLDKIFSKIKDIFSPLIDVFSNIFGSIWSYLVNSSIGRFFFGNDEDDDKIRAEQLKNSEKIELRNKEVSGSERSESDRKALAKALKEAFEDKELTQEELKGFKKFGIENQADFNKAIKDVGIHQSKAITGLGEAIKNLKGSKSVNIITDPKAEVN